MELMAPDIFGPTFLHLIDRTISIIWLQIRNPISPPNPIQVKQKVLFSIESLAYFQTHPKAPVEDASRKRSMDLRLLHGVAYGHSWFGRWGYKFYRGSFGVTEENYYYEAMEISNLISVIVSCKKRLMRKWQERL
ncbi:hypothetical protein P8452_06290 [Trifolium repens]|nr:hypothetical protein P8452_06290 [Trifolium repens]